MDGLVFEKVKKIAAEVCWGGARVPGQCLGEGVGVKPPSFFFFFCIKHAKIVIVKVNIG